MLFTALAVSAAYAQAMTVNVSGACPDVTLSGTGFHPNAPVVLLHSAEEGSAVIPGGPCQGVVTGMAHLDWLKFARVPPVGAFVFDQHLSESACGDVYQVLDMKSCQVSNVVVIPAVSVDTGLASDAGL